MKGWRECKLGDVVDIIPGFAFKSQHFSDYIGDAKVIKITDILPPVIDINNSMFVNLSAYDKKKLEKYIIKKKDFVVAMTGATIGKIGRMQTDEIAYINQRVATFRAKENTISDFVYYLINCPEFQAFIQNNIDSNSDQENISATSISRFPILLPPLPEQKAITAVLSSLDDKIDLLHRQNKTLEAMAETLFRQWFVEPCKNGLPEGWEEKSLGDVAEIKAGGDKPKVFSEIKTSICNVPVFSNGIDNEGLYGYTDNPKISVESITISARGTIGYVCLRQEPYVPIVRLISIAPNEDLVSSKFLYLWAKSQIISGTGTTQQQLTVPDLSRSKLIIPSYDVMRIFTMYIDVFFNKLNFNKSQIRTLEKLRDLLLPKLMSGEVRVKV